MWWTKMLNIRSCHEAGPILKFARWLSVPQVWEYFRQEIHLLRVPLEDMAKHTEELSTSIASSSTAQHDADLAQRMTTSKTGLIQRAPAYLTEELATHLDIITCVTAPLAMFYSHRTAEVKTPAEGLEENLKMSAEQSWLVLLSDVLHDGLLWGPHLRKMGCTATKPADERYIHIQIVFQYTFTVVSEIAVRFFPHMEGMPHSAIRFLQSNKNEMRNAVDEHLAQWKAILLVEEMAARGNPATLRLAADLPQRHQKLVRMIYKYLEHEEALQRPGAKAPPVGQITHHLATAVALKFPDEKIIEDCNGFIRDLSRVRRNKRFPMTVVHNKLLQCGVISSRGMDGPSVELSEIANIKNIKSATAGHSSTKHLYKAHVPENLWPESLDRILLPKRDWMSPGVQADF